MRTTFVSLSLVFFLSISQFALAESPTPAVVKTTGIVFKLSNNCGQKVSVEVNGKAFQIPNGASHRFDYPAGTKVYKLENGARGALLYTISASDAGKVLPVCK